MNDLIKLLESGVINISKVADEIYPDKKHGRILLNHKIRGHRGQKLNSDDLEKIKKYLLKCLEVLNI